MSAPDLPGAVGLTALRVYPWAAADGSQLPAWRERWRRGAAAVAERTGRDLDALATGNHSHLRTAAVARVEQPPQETLGMCGYLAPYRGRQRRRLYHHQRIRTASDASRPNSTTSCPTGDERPVGSCARTDITDVDATGWASGTE